MGFGSDLAFYPAGRRSKRRHARKDQAIRAMPVFKPRNRLVNFRLSEEEFEKLKASSSLNDARSLSDFARAAVMRTVSELASADLSANPNGKAVNDRRIAELESRIEELMRLMQALRGAPVMDAAARVDAATDVERR